MTAENTPQHPVVMPDFMQAPPMTTGDADADTQGHEPAGQTAPVSPFGPREPGVWGGRSDDPFGRRGRQSPFAPEATTPTPEPEPTPPSSGDDSAFNAGLLTDFGGSSAAANPTGELDVPSFLNDTPPQAPDATPTPVAPALPRRTPGASVGPASRSDATPRTPAGAATDETGGFLAGALTRQSGLRTGDTLPTIASPTPYLGDPDALRTRRTPATPNTTTPPAVAPAAAPRAPRPATPNTAPTPLTRNEQQVAGILASAEAKASELTGTSVAEILEFQITDTRQKFAKQLARHGSSMVGGNKQLQTAQEYYRASVDALGVYAAVQAERETQATKGRAMTDSEIRALSILGNLGDGQRDADGKPNGIVGEEEKFAEALRQQQLIRAGYDPKTRTETLGPNDEYAVEVVEDVTEPSGFKGVRIKVTRALDKLGETRKGKVARAVLVAGVGAGAVALLSGAAAATGGGAAVIAAGAFSGRLTKGIFATNVSNSRTMKAEAEYATNLEDVDDKRNDTNTQAVASFEEIINPFVGAANEERGEARKRAAKTGAIALLGTVGSYGAHWLADNASAIKHMVPGLGDSTAQHPSTGSHPSAGASPSPEASHGGGSQPTHPEAADKPQHSPGSGDREGNHPGSGTSGEATTNPDARTVTPGSTGTVSEDFYNAGIGFSKVATAANELIDKGELGKHLIGGDPNNYYYTGGSRAQIEAAIFQQMIDNGSIDADDFNLAA